MDTTLHKSPSHSLVRFGISSLLLVIFFSMLCSCSASNKSVTRHPGFIERIQHGHFNSNGGHTLHSPKRPHHNHH